MKKKPISIIVTIFLLFSTIGGAIGYNYDLYTWDAAVDHGSCHENDSGGPSYPYPYGGPSYESSTGYVNVTHIDPVKITVGMEFTVYFSLRNFTEIIEYPYGNADYDPALVGRNNETCIGISGDMGDNIDFMRDADTTPMYHGVEVDEDGNVYESGHGQNKDPLSLTLRAPFAGGNYELVVSAVAGLNHSSKYACNFTYALGSIILTVYTSAPAGVISTSGDDDDDDDDAEGAISGYILIITMATIFSISAVLILRMKKLMKNKSRNV